MRGEYKDVGKVIERIAAELLARYPDARAELFLDERGPLKPRKSEGALAELLPALVEFCKEMPRAWVLFEPAHPYGIVSKVVGHCHCPNGGCKTACTRYYERPRALLTLTRVGTDEVKVGGYLKPRYE